MSKGVQLALIGIIIISIVAATLLIYTGQPIPLLNRIVTVPFLEKSPTTVLIQAGETMNSLTSARYDVVFETSVTLADSPVFIKSQAIYQGSIGEQFIGKATIQTEVELQALRFLTDIELVIRDSMVYGRITELPAIPFADLDMIENQWYEVPVLADARVAIGLNGMMAANAYDVTRLKDQRINGVTAYHLRVRVPVYSIRSSIPIDLFSQTTATDITFDVWVGKKDFRVYALELQSDDAAGLAMSIGVSDFQIPVVVEVPKKSLPGVEFTADLFGTTNILDMPLFGSLVGLEFGDDATDPDGDNLLNIWERAFGSDSANPDTDDDQFLDGAEVRQGYSPTGEGRIFGLTE